jgi:hypothetical protein
MPDDKTLRCDCGYEASALDEAGLVEKVRRHARRAHGIAFSDEEALLVVFRSQLDLSRESIAMDTWVSRMSPNEGGER